MSINEITLLGRLVRDPEQRYSVTGKNITSFTLAVDRTYKNKNENEQTTDFINIVVWGKNGENVAKYIKKGNRLLVLGRLQIREYLNKNNEKRKITEVVARRVQFIDRPNNTEAAVPAADEAANTNTIENTNFDELSDESHPF